ncbi:MAG: hypothetical protein MZV63_26325 [Marinilabiliales bacterium]|nr:hypothetical protein [Marinilabiliales bacterium]
MRKRKEEANLLIAGMSAHICDRCIDQAHEIVLEELRKKGDFDVTKIKLSKPIEIKKLP